MIEFRYDGDADAIYIDLDVGASRDLHGQIEDAEHRVLVDRSNAGDLVGIEILGASNHPIFHALVPRLNGNPVVNARTRVTTHSGEQAT